MCVTHIALQSLSHSSTMSVFVHWFIYKYDKPVRSGCYNRTAGVPVGCANHYTTRTYCNEVSNIGIIEVDSHSNTSAKLFFEMVHHSYYFSQHPNNVEDMT